MPTSIVSKVVEDLKQYGVVQRAVLGVQISDISDEWAKEKGLKTLDGAYVHKVMDMSSAALAGIKEGDVIVAVNDVAVKSVSELQEQIGRYRPGDKVSVKIVRNNDYKTLTIELKNQQGTTDVVKNTSSIEVLGATFNTVDEKTARKLGISHGLQVKSVSKGKMQEAGIRNDFIILKVNNQIIRSEEDLLDVFKSASQGGSHEKVLFIAGAYPNGKVAYYAINLSE